MACPIVVNIHKLHKDVKTPIYASELAAGADVFAFLEEDLLLKPGDRFAVPTGFAVEIPEGYESQVRPRSGLALRNGIFLVNAPGTIDADYRGEVKILVGNISKEDFIIRSGMRIAQLILAPVIQILFEETVVLGTTERAGSGFGSTGL